jgi:alkanesulfonate monooxygenase SsuD/methylene tetrahydromethanopterin reductase-like flavin-dependent oxidoreductase (luciferase family)
VSGVVFDLQVNPGCCDWVTLRAAAEAAQGTGFDTLWIADHLAGDMMGAPSMPECFTTLGALAAVTSHIGLGSLVVNAATRHPGIVANAAATVQQISQGRFTLGLGAGASPSSRFARELDALGIEVPSALSDRHRRLVDSLGRIDAMWSPDRDERYRGFPLPSPRPKVILGVNSVSLACIAAEQTDGVNVRVDHPRRTEILSAAGEAKRANFTVSVWAPFDESLLDPQNELRVQLVNEGVNRIVMLMSGTPDVERIASVRLES